MGDSADVVEMLMAAEDDLHLAKVEAELADIRRDQVRPRLGAAVDENAAA
jgi:hypothetical protein